MTTCLPHMRLATRPCKKQTCTNRHTQTHLLFSKRSIELAAYKQIQVRAFVVYRLALIGGCRLGENVTRDGISDIGMELCARHVQCISVSQ